MLQSFLIKKLTSVHLVLSQLVTKSLKSLCAVKEGKHSHHFNPMFVTRVVQSLAGCEYLPCIFGVSDRS